MRKFTSFLFVLFMAMVVKAQTEAVTTTYNFEDGNKAFVDRSRISSNIVAESGYDGSSALLFTCAHNASNGYSFSNFDISSLVGNPKTVTISLQYYNTKDKRAILTIGDASVRGITGNSDRVTYNERGAIFALGGIRASSADWSYLNGKKLSNGYLSDKWLDVNVKVNIIDKIYSYSIKESATGTVLESEEDIAYFSSEALACTQIDLFGRENNSQCAYIDNLVITVEPDVRSYADYSVAYVDESRNVLKENVVYNGLVGDPATLTEADKEAFKNSDNTKKYIYESDDAADKTIANDGSTVVTVTFREAETWSYTANAVDGGANVLKVLGAGSNFEGETIKVPYNQYILKGGVLYEREKGVSYNNEFNWAFTLSADKQISNLTYNVSSLANVVYFSEAEDIDGMTDVTTGNANIRCSNSVGAYNASETPVELLTLTPGTYTITAQVWGNKNKVTDDTQVPVPLYVKCGNDTLEVGTQGYLTSGSKEFIVTENAKVIIPKAGSSGSSPKCIDWILIQSSEANSLLVVEDGKNLDVEGSYGSATYTRSIAAGAYGTICLPFAPDAASLEAYNFYELTASTVSGIAGEVTFTKVAAPEANKPYIYCLADKDATEAPAITGGATKVSTEAGTTIISDWQMVGSFKADTVDCTDKAIYALNNGTPQKLMKVTKTLTVPAYRAYIEGTSSQLDLQMLTVRISGPTGFEQISAADVEGLLPATIYDLMGRPVQNPQKGHLYIQGGKKVVY